MAENVQWRFHQKLFVTETTKATTGRESVIDAEQVDTGREHAEIGDVPGSRPTVANLPSWSQFVGWRRRRDARGARNGSATVVVEVFGH